MSFKDITFERATMLLDADYCDDIAIMLSGKSSRVCIDRSVAATGIVQDVFSSHGMDLSFKPGKSEAILVLCGKGSVVEKQILADAQWTIPVGSSTKLDLRIVD